jgi:hypothetical protein
VAEIPSVLTFIAERFASLRSTALLKLTSNQQLADLRTSPLDAIVMNLATVVPSILATSHLGAVSIRFACFGKAAILRTVAFVLPLPAAAVPTGGTDGVPIAR